MALCAYGFLTPGVIGGLCFGGGLGITLFGIMYMFVHDGLVHRCGCARVRVSISVNVCKCMWVCARVCTQVCGCVLACTYVCLLVCVYNIGGSSNKSSILAHLGITFLATCSFAAQAVSCWPHCRAPRP
jgi:hypothetical protein